MKKMILAAAAIALLPVSAFAQDADVYNDEEVVPTARDGLRAEARVMYETITAPDGDVVYEMGSGVSFGGEVGYDIAISNSVVLGPYAGYEVSTSEDCDGSFCVSSGGLFTAGLHAGFATGADGQVFVKLGYASLTIDAAGPVGGVTVDESESGSGANFAVGYEHGFGKAAYVRVEVNGVAVTDIYGFDFQRGGIGAAIGMRF